MAEADLEFRRDTFKSVITIGASLLGFIENSCLDKPGTLAQRTAVAEGLNQLFVTEIGKELKKRVTSPNTGIWGALQSPEPLGKY